MPSLKDIRKRITSVKNTQKITRALKLVSAAKLNRSQRALGRLKPYAMKQNELISDLVAEVGEEASALFAQRSDVKRIAALIVASDRGMCGGFNSNLFKHAANYIRNRQAEGAAVVCWSLGRRVEQFVKKEGYEVGGKMGEVLAADLMDRIPEVAERLISGFTSGEFDEVVIISNRFVNAITQNPETESYLPVPSLASAGSASGDRLYEPGQQNLLDYILPRALETKLRQLIMESITGEHAARMNAMNNASDNAAEMINSLTLAMNRARQAAITTELMEIISGAEALK